MGRTGLSTQLNVCEAGSYGEVPLVAALNRSVEIRSEEIEDSQEAIESETLRAGKSVQSHWVQNRKGAEGDVEFEILTKGFGLFLKHLAGAVAVTTPPGATLARDITATIGDIDGKSLSVQVGRPEVGGTIVPVTFVGVKVAEWEIGQEVDGLALLTLSLDCQASLLSDETPAGPALAAAAYPAGVVPLGYPRSIFSIDGAQFDAGEVTWNGANNLKTDRYFLRDNPLKKEPLQDTEARELTAEWAGEFTGAGAGTAWRKYRRGEEGTLGTKWIGPEIEVGFNFELEVTASRVRFDGGSPTASDSDVIEQPGNVKILQPSSGSAITLRYRTTDVSP